MQKNYSKSEILKFLYGELDPAEEKDFVEALYSNEELFQEFEQLQEAHQGLSEVKVEVAPSEAAVQAVMSHVARTPARPERAQLGIVGRGLPGVRFFATVGMVTFSLVLVGFLLFAWQKASQPLASAPAEVTSWEAPAIHNRINVVKANLNNLSGSRLLPIEVRHNTYRLVNTGRFEPEPAPVVLVNVK